MNRYKTYTAYSIAVAMVWAVLLVVATAFAPTSKFKKIPIVFLGFAIGWLSATTARYVYPPPKKYRRPEQQPT